MTEEVKNNNKYTALISDLRTKLLTMGVREWVDIGERVTADPEFKRENDYGGAANSSLVDNLPLTLKYILPNAVINQDEAVDLAIAIGSDTTLKEEAHPLLPLLRGDLSTMRQRVPDKD